MARSLSYTTIPLSNAKTIDFSQILETSWDTARWNSAATEVMVHWEGKTPTSILSILKQTGGTVTSHSLMLTEIDSKVGRAAWGIQPSPPPKPKK